MYEKSSTPSELFLLAYGRDTLKFMDIEKLNKSQIVLLTLLVSFVTSIATGIVTVALMEDAPPAITQTVNRIVERTIETVASEGQMAAVAESLPPETIIIRESDLLPQAVAAIEPSIVRLFAGQQFVGIGIVLDASGIIVADANVPAGQLTALRSDGVSVPVVSLERRDGDSTAYFQATAAGASADASQVTWTPVRKAGSTPGLGSTVVAIGGTNGTRIAVGVITATSDSSAEDGDGFIATDIAPASYVAGSPLITTNGELVGIAVGGAENSGFLAAGNIALYNQSTSAQ